VRKSAPRSSACSTRRAGAATSSTSRSASSTSSTPSCSRASASSPLPSVTGHAHHVGQRWHPDVVLLRDRHQQVRGRAGQGDAQHREEDRVRRAREGGRPLVGQVEIEVDPSLPLDNLDKNVVCADALFTEWPEVDAIVGNPPFLGDRKIRRRARARLPRAAPGDVGPSTASLTSPATGSAAPTTDCDRRPRGARGYQRHPRRQGPRSDTRLHRGERRHDY
jgi:hypothetical protein